MSAPKLHLFPLPLREANAWIERHHRHHDPVRGCLFSLGAARGPVVVGVAIVGRPVAREAPERLDGRGDAVLRRARPGA